MKTAGRRSPADSEWCIASGVSIDTALCPLARAQARGDAELAGGKLELTIVTGILTLNDKNVNSFQFPLANLQEGTP